MVHDAVVELGVQDRTSVPSGWTKGGQAGAAANPRASSEPGGDTRRTPAPPRRVAAEQDGLLYGGQKRRRVAYWNELPSSAKVAPPTTLSASTVFPWKKHPSSVLLVPIVVANQKP
jgi:hypothetical protein